MSESRRSPAFATDDWMFEQQVRAEMEAEAWRRLREETRQPAPQPVAPPPQAAAPARSPHRTGSTMLKALVRFCMSAAAAYLAFIAALDSQLGEFEAWLAVGAAFVVTLALSMFSPLRGAVHTLAETMRWVLVLALGVGGLWMFFQMSA
ncbi:MAG: hypothetical protein M0D54_08665 [Hyphomonadaceae bacterium JAD_PAG50586_4]|nr:MAG: hypothetical protein M0D54_08665 [Hyphomonadaceae bacterium JAD_PAG50586_4]